MDIRKNIEQELGGLMLALVEARAAYSVLQAECETLRRENVALKGAPVPGYEGHDQEGVAERG